jgi:hypothetical protein
MIELTRLFLQIQDDIVSDVPGLQQLLQLVSPGVVSL